MTLRQALDDLAAYVNPAIRYWIDADWKFHWTINPTGTIIPGTAPGPLRMMFPVTVSTLPTAPRSLTDGTANHTTTFNYENFSIEYDDQGWADSVYVNGATGYTYLPSTGTVGTGGSGWAGGITQLGRQRLLAASNSDTKAARDAYGGSALATASQAVRRGTATVVCDFGGWLPGQGLNITNAQAGLSSTQFMI